MYDDLTAQKDTLELLRRVGAVITDSHIVYTSGKHGSAYINKDALYPHTRLTACLCRAIAEEIVKDFDDIETVIAPAVGGVILSQRTADYLTVFTSREVMSVYAEKAPDGDEFVIKRGYDKHVFGKNVLVVEDILNTGGSVKKVVDAVRAAGGNVSAVAALCNRGGVERKDIGNPPYLFTLSDIKMDAWDASECPLCKEGVPINVAVGHGREFLARQQIS